MEFEITVEEAKARIEGGDVVLVDVREPWEIETASLVGAKLIPMGDIPTRVQELDPDAHILVLCHHGRRSLQVTSWMREQGYAKTQSVRGGIDAWSKQVDSKVPVY
jgi:rhodanese-related sulfurtransferase